MLRGALARFADSEGRSDKTGAEGIAKVPLRDYGHYMTPPLVELYGGCVVVLKVPRCGVTKDVANDLQRVFLSSVLEGLTVEQRMRWSPQANGTVRRGRARH